MKRIGGPSVDCTKAKEIVSLLSSVLIYILWLTIGNWKTIVTHTSIHIDQLNQKSMLHKQERYARQIQWTSTDFWTGAWVCVWLYAEANQYYFDHTFSCITDKRTNALSHEKSILGWFGQTGNTVKKKFGTNYEQLLRLVFFLVYMGFFFF